MIIRLLSDVEIQMNEKERLTSARSSETPCLLYLGPRRHIQCKHTLMCGRDLFGVRKQQENSSDNSVLVSCGMVKSTRV